MTSTLRLVRTLAIAAVVVFYGTTGAPQSVGSSQGHQGHRAAAPSQKAGPGMAGMAAMHGEVKAQIAALDDRIKVLAGDMQMFSGEMKIDTMAALLTALVERQSLMGRQMQGMQDRMMRGLMSQAPAASVAEEEPEAMCAPSS